MQKAPPYRTDACVAALLLSASMLVFWPGLSGEFLFDDYPNLVLAPDWKVSGVDPSGWRRAMEAGITGSAGRPLAMLSFAANHALTGMDPYWLKLTSLLLHAFNGLLVFLLCQRIFSSVPWRGTTSRPGRLAAGIVAAVWLLHPLQASTVLYIVQRMEIGAATGTLLALLAYCRARRLQLEGRPGSRWLLAALAATVFGCGFKESAALAPLFALVLETCVFRFATSDGRASRPWMACYALLAIASVGIFMGYVLPVMGSDAAYAGRNFTLGQRLLTQLPALMMYLRQALVPSLESLKFYYDNFPVSSGLLSPASTAAALTLLVAMVAVAIASWRWRPLVTLGIGWFFAAHAMTSNVVPLELAFEHRNYLALLGLPLALVTPVRALGARMSAEARIAAISLPVLGLAALCGLQAATWGKPFQLAWTLENRNPTSSRASFALGQAFLARADNDTSTPDWALARAQFMRTALLDEPSPLAVQAVLLMDAQSHRPIDPALWDTFRSLLHQRPFDAESLGAVHAIVECQVQRRCSFDDDQVLRTIVSLLGKNSSNPALLTVYANYAWNVLHDRALALRLQRDAVRIAPKDPAFGIALAKFEQAAQQQQHWSIGKSVTP